MLDAILNTLAQANPFSDQEFMAFAAGAIGVIVIIFGIVLVIWGVVAWLMYRVLVRIPPGCRTIEPFVPWLFMIPVVNVVIAIICGINIPESLNNYFSTLDDEDYEDDYGRGRGRGRGRRGPRRYSSDDYGRGVGLTWGILKIVAFVGGWLPFINILAILAYLAALVLCIVFLVKINQYIHELPEPR